MSNHPFPRLEPMGFAVEDTGGGNTRLQSEFFTLAGHHWTITITDGDLSAPTPADEMIEIGVLKHIPRTDDDAHELCVHAVTLTYMSDPGPAFRPGWMVGVGPEQSRGLPDEVAGVLSMVIHEIAATGKYPTETEPEPDPAPEPSADRCPVCHEYDPEVDGLAALDDESISLMRRCKRCGARWDAVYTATWKCHEDIKRREP